MERISPTVRIVVCAAWVAAACATVDAASPSSCSSDACVLDDAESALVTVAEFYHRGLDQFFLTADAAEIEALTSGLIPGWQPTTGNFPAYLRPQGPFDAAVCRFYDASPTGGGHFLTAFGAECATLASGGSGWVLESAAAFYVALPDAVTGACADGVPIYRLWKVGGGADHRYVEGKVGRDQLVDVLHRYRSEGYGPDGVAFCVPVPAEY